MSYIDCCDWEECTLCGKCLVKCPVMNIKGREAKAEVERLRSGQEPERVLNECTLCMRCNSFCPKGLSPYELIMQRVSEQRDRKERVPGFVPFFLTGIGQPTFFQSVYDRMSDYERNVLERWAVPPNSKELMFVGCSGRMFAGDIENSRVLRSLPKWGPAEVCCGELHYRSGMWDAWEMNGLGIDRMVCYCGSCYNFLENIMPKALGIELDFEVTHIYDWMLDRLERGEIEVRKPIDMKLAVHEACYTTELGPEYYETLRKLYTAAGADLVELPHNRDEGLCCGAASVAREFKVRSIFREQGKKYKEFKEAGARDVAVNCLGCYLTFEPMCRLRGVRMHYMVEELLRAFGDDIDTPVSSRIPLINRVIARHIPRGYRRIPLNF
jgi:Fe-S oxidoreductase